MKTTYSRRELYALGEPLGNSATEKKLGYGAIYGGGGGGGVLAVVAVVVTVAAAIMTDGASLAIEAGAEAGTAAAAEGIAATDAAISTADAGWSAAEAANFAADTATVTEGAAGTAALETTAATEAANSAATDAVLSKVGEGAAKGAVTSGLRDVITGRTDNLFEDVAIGAVSGGVGAGVGSAATNFMDANPIVSGALAGASGSGTNASLHGSNDVLGALTTGAVAGGAGGAGQMATQGQNLGPLASGAIKGAIQGGAGAVLKGGSILNNSLIGAAGGAAGSAVGSAVNDETGSKLLSSVLGGTAGSLAKTEANQLINGVPTVPGQYAPVQSQPKTVAAGSPRTGMNTASGTPNALAYGNPTAANTRTNLSGQTGIPNIASTSGGTSDVSLVGNTTGAGIQSGSNPNLNTGSASNISPTSGLNASGLPALLSAGLLSSQQPDNTTNQSDQVALKLSQLYPNLNPKLASMLAANPPQTQAYKRGGSVHMAEGGDPDLMAKLQAIEGRAQKTRANTHLMAAQKALGPQTQYAANVPFGNPAGNYNKPITPGYFIAHANEGGGIYGMDHGDGAHSGHNPQFVTGATGHYVKGKGDGQSDDIPAMLADGEYVFDADTVAQLGNGSSDAGAKLLDHFRESLREHKRSAPSDKIPPKAAPLAYMKEALKRHKG